MTVKQFLHERPGLEMKTQFDSLVQRAFRGALLPTEAELARHEGRSFEPASALLAKIEAQRKDVKPQRKGQNAEKGLLDKNNVRFQILCIKNHY